jgi:hypothetical protein
VTWAKFVDHDYLANVTRLNVATLAWLASAPAASLKVRFETKELANDSTLLRDSSPGGLASGCQVLWRATSRPEWEHAENVGDISRATLPLSKDNIVFAVRAVDHEGRFSLPVVPRGATTRGATISSAARARGRRMM